MASALAASKLLAYEPPSFEALAKLDGKQFLEAAEEASNLFHGRGFGSFAVRPYTVDQLIAIAEKCRVVVNTIGSHSDNGVYMNPFCAYFTEACKKANDDQLDKLIELYLRLDPDSFEWSQTLPMLAGRVLARELVSLPPQHVELTDGEPVLPPELKSAPDELKNAWTTFQRAKTAFEKAFPKPTEPVDAGVSPKSLHDIIGDALRGATGREDELRPFARRWPNCMGITDMEDAHDIAMLLMLLRERRMNEAIGAALRVAGTQGSTSSPQDLAKPVIDLLERCGLSWEEIFAGGQVENEARGWEEESRHPYLDALASHGSERAAPLVKGLAHFAKPRQRAKYLATLGAWVETAPNLRKCKGEEYSYWSSEQKMRLAKPMPRSVQEMALHLTEEFATPDASGFQVDIAVDTFARTQSASSIRALQALTRHSWDDVANHAKKVLCAMEQESSH